MRTDDAGRKFFLLKVPFFKGDLGGSIFILLVAQIFSILLFPVITNAKTITEVAIADRVLVNNNPTIKILSPTAKSTLDVSSGDIVVEFAKGATIELKLNGNLVDRALISNTQIDDRSNTITQTWSGVTFINGENTIAARSTLDGITGPETSIKIKVKAAIAKIIVETQEARIIADGRSTATVRGKLIDRLGKPVNRSVYVSLFANSGKFVGTDLIPTQTGFQLLVKQGEFTIPLRSSVDAQMVTIAVQAEYKEAFTQIQFDTLLRQDPILTGSIDLRLGARGTDYYSSLRDFLPTDKDNNLQLDFNSAVFATGSIGEWQFRGAFNSDRALNKDCNCNNRLFGTYQDSKLDYPVYGDESTVEKTAPSTDNFYFRLERTSKIEDAGVDYFMWGDYDTDEFVTASQQFSATNRLLHGFKANYNFGNLQLTGLYSNTTQGFQRDSIAPDGTSGDYFLSRRLVVPGSEYVYLELEELDRPGTVIQRKKLYRGYNYQIDYVRGTILFREPILRTAVGQNGEILARKITVTYQFDNNGSDTNIYGGRVRYHFGRKLKQESWIGASFFLEDKDKQDFQLFGADALISFGENGRLIAEYAHSTNEVEFNGAVTGSAYRLELYGKINDVFSGKAYYRSADPGFSNNATVTFVPGQTRYGAQLKAKVSPQTTLDLQFDREENFGTAPRPLNLLDEIFSPTTQAIPSTKVDNNLTTISAGIEQKIGQATLDVDWIWRERNDRIYPSYFSGTTNQLRSRLILPIIKDELTFQALNETTLSGNTDPLVSDRTALQLDWQARPGIKLSLVQNWFTRGIYAGRSITGLGINADYKLGTDTTLTARYSLLNSGEEMGTQGSIGIKQNWNIATGLRMTFAYERIIDDFFGQTAAGSRSPQPYTVGLGASSLGFGSGDSYSVGLEYNNYSTFKASAKFEHRTSSFGNNTVITTNLKGKISPALTALVDFNRTSSANQTLNLGETINLRAGLGYRNPKDDRFNALLRYEYRKNPNLIPESILLGSGTGSESHIFSAEAIYAPSWRWEFYAKYAWRSSTTFLANDFVSRSTASLLQLRASYRLNYNFDLVGEARWLIQDSANYSETGYSIETGYYLTPELRLAAGYAFGKIDDPDFNGSRSAGGPYLGLSVKLNGLFDGFGEQPAI
jgi:hypothetical protein